MSDNSDLRVVLDTAPEGAGGQAYSGYYSNSSAPILQSDDSPVQDYLRMVYRRRWTVLTVFLVVAVVAMAYSTTGTPRYEATARLLIDTEKANIVVFKQVIEDSQERAEYYQTQVSLLQSRALARKTLDRLNAWARFGRGKAPASAVPPPPPTLWRTIVTSISSFIANPFGMFDQGASDPTARPDETAAQASAIRSFLGGLSVEPVRNSHLVDVRYVSPDPVLAANAVNTLAKAYIDQSMEFKFLASKDATDWLAERLNEQRKAVEESELALQRYREQNGAVAVEDRQNIVVQKLADLNAAVTRAKTERIEKEELYKQLQASQNDPAALDTFPAILSNAFIQQQKNELANLQNQQSQLGDKLLEKHPEMTKIRAAIQTAQAKLQGEIGKVVQSVRTEYLTAVAQERSLTDALQQQQRDALAMNRKGIEYGVLQREAQSNRQIYDSLMLRAKETGVTGELKNTNIRIVDEAEVPRGPIPTHPNRIRVLGLFGGLFLGIGLALAFEMLDNRIKMPEDIVKYLGVPFVGLLPMVLSAEDEESLLLNNGVPPVFAEACRSLRTNVLFSTAHEGGRTVIVTSAGPGEGKTVVSSNLSVALAQTGLRVLLVDGDMRRPRMHKIFGLKQTPGLSNFIVGTVKASEIVLKTSVPGLWVLAAGDCPPNPAELLGSKRLLELLEAFRNHFDWVIIDSPPLLPVTDAAILAHSTSGVLFVVAAEKTSRAAARTGIEQLDRVQAKLLGGVLNRVNLERDPYYYSKYYSADYAKYYVTSTTS